MRIIAAALVVTAMVVVDFASDLAVHAGKISAEDDKVWDSTMSVALGVFIAMLVFDRRKN